MQEVKPRVFGSLGDSFCPLLGRSFLFEWRRRKAGIERGQLLSSRNWVAKAGLVGNQVFPERREIGGRDSISPVFSLLPAFRLRSLPKGSCLFFHLNAIIAIPTNLMITSHIRFLSLLSLMYLPFLNFFPLSTIISFRRSQLLSLFLTPISFSLSLSPLLSFR